MSSYSGEHIEKQSARTTREILTQQPQTNADPVKERLYQNAQIAKSYNCKRDGISTEKEVAKDWAYRFHAEGDKAITPHADKDIAMKLAVCGHHPNEIAKGIEKHSIYAAQVEKEQGKEHAQAYAMKTGWHPVEVVKTNEKYQEIRDTMQELRQNLGKKQLGLEEVPGYSAKAHAMEKNMERYQQEQQRKLVEQQAHQVSRNIVR